MHRSIPGAACIVLAAVFILATGVQAFSLECRASYYGAGEKLSRHTANGEVFRSSGLTAASWHHRFGTKLRVTYRGRSVVVRVNDRGPAKRLHRCVDLSYASAKAIGLTRAGVATVSIEVVR